ncbi:MAG: DUF484 family protein [Limnobacter sp.]|nr:DUF484 family protein [Limnobacter sp.]
MSLGATEVADFLKDNPDFLNHNPGILAFVSLPSSAAGNVSSLQERQVQTLRDKVRIMEQRLVEMTRAAVENHSIIQSLQSLQRSLLAVRDPSQLPAVLVQGVKDQFKVPQVQLRIWNKLPEFLPSGLDPQPAPTTLDNLTALRGLYCGFAEMSPYTEIFDQEEVKPRSVVIIPLRIGAGTALFGCLALGSPDKDRFSPTLETDFLDTLAEASCAALSRLTRVEV